MAKLSKKILDAYGLLEKNTMGLKNPFLSKDVISCKEYEHTIILITQQGKKYFVGDQPSYPCENSIIEKKEEPKTSFKNSLMAANPVFFGGRPMKKIHGGLF